jgi:hypothetical protein
MSVTYISAELRRLVAARAEGLCEYCLIAEEDTFLGCAVDHVISEKHGGPTAAENLALACVFCNQAKGSDVGSIDPGSGAFVRFFNPRLDRWADHFTLAGDRIEPKTPTGAVTARILGFNRTERLLERQALRLAGRYLSAAARARVRD